MHLGPTGLPGRGSISGSNINNWSRPKKFRVGSSRIDPLTAITAKSMPDHYGNPRARRTMISERLVARKPSTA